jgi:hypothetical protein
MLLDMIDGLIDNATAMTEMNSFKKEWVTVVGMDVSVPEDIDVLVSECMLIGWTVAYCAMM